MRRHRSHYNRRPDSRSPSMVLPKASSLSSLASDSIESGDGMSLARLTRLRSARSMISRRLASLASCSAANPRGITCEAFRSELFPFVAVSATAIVRFAMLLWAQSGKSTEFFARIAQKTMRLKHKHNLLLARYAYALYMTQMTYSRDTKTIEADSLPQSPHNRGECPKSISFSCVCDDLDSFRDKRKTLPTCPNCRYAMLCDRLSRFQTHSSCRCTR